MAIQPLDAVGIRQIARHTPNCKAGGTDCWAAREVKIWPELAFELLIILYATVESGANWPTGVARGRISLIDKEAGSQAQHMRPLTVLTFAYRWWSAWRLRDVNNWMTKWAHRSLGAKPGGDCQAVWMQFALKLERAKLEGKRAAGISIDFSKYFDWIPREDILWP